VASATKRVAKPEIKEEATHVLRIERWSDLGIGIDEDGAFLAVTPCPEYGMVFPKRIAKELHLPGKQWKGLLSLLAQSQHGNTARKRDLLVAFDYLTSADISAEVLDELRADTGKMNKLKTVRGRLTGAIAHLARNLRKLVDVRSASTEKLLSAAEAEFVQSGFVVRYLKRGPSGKLRFGGTGSRDG